MLFRILACCLHVYIQRKASLSEQAGPVADASAAQHGSQCTQHLAELSAQAVNIHSVEFTHGHFNLCCC